MHELPKTWLPNAVVDEDGIVNTSSTDAFSAPDHDSAGVSSTHGPLDVEETSSGTKPHDASKTLYFGEMHRHKPGKMCNTKSIAYDVEIPKPINAADVFSSISSHQPPSSNSSASSNFSPPNLSAETEAELLAILAENRERSPSHASISEHRYSPLLRRESETCDLDTRHEIMNSASRSPSVIFLHEWKGPAIPQEAAESQNIKADVERLLSQYPPLKEDMEQSKRTGAQQEVVELGELEGGTKD